MLQKRLYIPAVLYMAFSALFFPFWGTIAAFVIFTFIFENFYPGLVILIMMDSLYGFRAFSTHSLHGLLSLLGIVAYVLIGVLKRSLFHHY